MATITDLHDKHMVMDVLLVNARCLLLSWWPFCGADDAAAADDDAKPFHDFSEGPDQWNADDYKMYMEQLAKLKMNFIGLHTYPNQEPTVWTGTVDQFDAR